jgi:methanogenic corrinoid protein MtbC1
MRTLRLPLDEEARGARVVLSTLPGEAHALGLHMVALLLNAAGSRVVMLGPELPTDEIAGAAREQETAAVGIGVSLSSDQVRSRTMLLALRRALTAEVALVVGGAGAPSVGRGVESLATLDEAHDWARRLSAARSRS